MRTIGKEFKEFEKPVAADVQEEAAEKPVAPEKDTGKGNKEK